MPLACLKLSRIEVGKHTQVLRIRCPVPPYRKQMEGLEQGAVFLAAVSLFLSCLMPTVLSADPCIPRFPLIALLGTQGSGLLAGVHLSSCILICVLAHSLSQKQL